VFLNWGHSQWDVPVTHGWSRKKINEELVQRVVENTWTYPNVTYVAGWEYNWASQRYGKDVDGRTHKWWVAEIKARGAAIDSGVQHLIGVWYAREHPKQARDADFMVSEFRNCFYPVRVTGGVAYNGGRLSEHSFQGVFDYGVPMVHLSMGLNYMEPPVWLPDELRRILPHGTHPSPLWNHADGPLLDAFVQARWYMENVRSWRDEPGQGGGDEITYNRLPAFVATSRPQLLDVAGYTAGSRPGAGVVDFACTYRDADGDAPAQAEVWVDRNGDGVFDPDPGHGERIAMAPAGSAPSASDYRGGVTFSASAVDVDSSFPSPRDLYYVFRFADAHWVPPVCGGVVPGDTQAISYDHHVIAEYSPGPVRRPSAPPNPRVVGE
jgi:hypothetical protein